MHFKSILIIALSSLAIASPVVQHSPADSKAASLLVRAINKSMFTEAELANLNPETCCCCKPPNQITNVEVLHRLIAASE